ncbi:MAG: ATP synthase F1 subunit epsilon [Elusimicrobiaceae bacterium]|jgi:F-type H+-transporting ATPase subunit epsilon
MAKLKLSIVTPERRIGDYEVDFVAIPAAYGEMGILPGHTACVVRLAEGILRYKDGQTENEFAVMGGYAEVFNDEISVFAESAALAGEINEEKERQAVQKAKDALLAKEKDMDIEAVQASLRKASLRIKLLEKHRRH